MFYLTSNSLQNCHEMVINAVHTYGNVIFTGAFNGKIRRWSFDEMGIECDGELDVGICINTMVGSADGNILYVGGSDGAVREVVFE